MTAADIELAKMVYLASALGIVLFTSMILRGLWRPLRFLLISVAISIFFTPYFLTQKMPAGSEQNIVPSFVVTLHKAAEDRERWREIIHEIGKPIAFMSIVNASISLILAVALPKPRKKIKSANPKKEKKAKQKKSQNPYLPDDFEPTTSQSSST